MIFDFRNQSWCNIILAILVVILIVYGAYYFLRNTMSGNNGGIQSTSGSNQSGNANL